MGQIIVVQAASETTTAAVLERGIEAFRALTGAGAADAWSAPGFGVATFARLNGTGPPIRRSARASGFVTAAGTWTCAGPDRDPLANFEALAGKAAGFPGAVAESDGLFLVAAGGPDSVTCATDRGGRLHAYVAEVDGCVIVSTSALVLAALSGGALDPDACLEMLGTGSVFEDRSLFRGVRKLEPATIYEIRDGRIRSRSRYWEVRGVFSPEGAPRAATAPALAEALTDAVARTLAPFEKPIVDLTGGFDSRGIVAAALAGGRPFECVVNGRDGDPDVVSAEAIASRFRIGLHRLRPGIDFDMRAFATIERAAALTDGEFDAVEYAGILEIHERLARRGDATVNGSAGEVCRGYWWDLLSPHTGSRTHFDHARAARRFVPDDWTDGIVAARGPRLAQRFEDVIRRANEGLAGLPNTVLADNIYLTLRMHRWAGRLASATDRIWPCATPFMFRRPVEIALAAPIADRARNRMARRLIEHLNPELAAMPMAGGYPASPIRIGNLLRHAPLLREIGGKVLARVTRRFAKPSGAAGGNSVVADLWAQEEVSTLLRPATMRTAGLYRPEALADFLRGSEAPGFSSGKKLGRILTLELVARMLARARRP